MALLGWFPGPRLWSPVGATFPPTPGHPCLESGRQAGESVEARA